MSGVDFGPDFDPALLDYWIEALESREFAQGRGKLRWENDGKPTHCCLGVLCEIVQPGFEIPRSRVGFYRSIASSAAQSFDYPIAEITEAVGLSGYHVVRLAEANDRGGATFSEIAAALRRFRETGRLEIGP